MFFFSSIVPPLSRLGIFFSKTVGLMSIWHILMQCISSMSQTFYSLLSTCSVFLVLLSVQPLNTYRKLSFQNCILHYLFSLFLIDCCAVLSLPVSHTEFFLRLWPVQSFFCAFQSPKYFFDFLPTVNLLSSAFLIQLLTQAICLHYRHCTDLCSVSPDIFLKQKHDWWRIEISGFASCSKRVRATY